MIFPLRVRREKKETRKGKNKMKAKFITVKGPGSLATEPFYMGVLQHERAQQELG